MKVVFERESFLAAFQLAAAVAPNRSPRAILENVKLEIGEVRRLYWPPIQRSEYELRYQELKPVSLG